MTPKVGDRVKAYCRGNRHNEGWMIGVLTRYTRGNDIAYLKVTESEDHGYDGRESACWGDTIELLSPPIDPSAVRLRRGGPAVTVARTRDADRPYRATVDTPSGPLMLTYDKYGRHYPDGDGPLDLVQV